MDICILIGSHMTPELQQIIQEKSDQLWIGVDRGALFLIQAGLRPHLSIGDFDSVSEEEYAEICSKSKTVVQAPVEKDETDSELALLQAHKSWPQADYHIYFASLDRFDHLLHNFLIPAYSPFRHFANQIFYHHESNDLAYYLPGKHQIWPIADKPILAFAILKDTKALSLGGVAYPLEKVDIESPRVFTSNSFVERSGQLSFEKGLVLVIQSRDQNS